MNDYVKPCTRENNPDHIIFHAGTNDIPSTKTPECIAQSISDLAKVYYLRTVTSLFPISYQGTINGTTRSGR